MKPFEILMNGLLLLVNGIGLPVLVREYGEVRTPPSAVVGIVSAVYHASRKPAYDSEVQALRTAHRTLVYRLVADEFLLVLVFELGNKSMKPGSLHQMTMAGEMLHAVFSALRLVIGSTHLLQMETAKLRMVLTRHVDIVDDTVRRFRSDVALLLGRPLYRKSAWADAKSVQMADDACEMILWVEKGVILLEHSGSRKTRRLSSLDLVLLIQSCERMKAKGAMKHATLNIYGQEDERMEMFMRLYESGVACIAIFSGQSKDEREIQAMMDPVLPVRARSSEGFTSDFASPMPRRLLQSSLPSTFLCCFISRADRLTSPSSRTMPYLHPSWQDTLQTVLQAQGTAFDPETDINERFLWQVLREFIGSRFGQSGGLSTDFKRQDEVLSLLHHRRGPLQFFVLCAGSIDDLRAVVAVGDALSAYFLMNA